MIQKTLWIHYFSFFSIYLGFLVESIFQTLREEKIRVKDVKLIALLKSIDNMILVVFKSANIENYKSP